jgi:hypothetical protein
MAVCGRGSMAVGIRESMTVGIRESGDLALNLQIQVRSKSRLSWNGVGLLTHPGHRGNGHGAAPHGHRHLGTPKDLDAELDLQLVG